MKVSFAPQRPDGAYALAIPVWSEDMLADRLAGLDPATTLGENAARLYGFDLEKLAALSAKYAPTPDELSVPLAEHEFPQKVHTAAFRR